MASSEDDKTRVVTKQSKDEVELGNALPLGSRIAEFELTGIVGEGGFGIVYLAYDHSLERSVALKEYMPSSLASRVPGSSEVRVKTQRNADTFKAGLRSFVNEAKVLAQFDHPALIKVYRFWEQHGTAYMVMPYYEGLNLKEWLAKQPERPDEATLKRLLGPVLEALDVIHRAQIYHRDIAPDNILLLDGERPLLLDFGAARRVIGDMTQALTVILKPGYAPIEQYAEVPGMKQGAFTDIYALGALIYYAIIGRTPPPSVARMVEDSMTPLAEAAKGRYSDEFLKAVDHCLAVRQEDRPQSIREMWGLLGIPQEQFTQVMAGNGDVDGSRHIEQLDSDDAGSRMPMILGGIALVAAAVGGWFLIGGDKDPDPVAPVIAEAPQPPATEKDGPDAPPAEPPSVDPVQPPVVEAPVETPPVVEKPPVEKPVVEPPVETPTRPPVTEVETPPVQAPPLIAAPTLDPVSVLQAMYQQRDPNHRVEVEVNRTRVRIGKDKPSFTLRTTEPGYLYVMMVGTDSEHLIVLFPNALDRNNRIEPGRKLTLPRPGWSFVAGGPPGINHLIAVVSKSPRDYGPAGMERGDPFDEFRLDRVIELREANGGSLDFAAGRAECEADAPCPASYGAKLFSIEEIR